MQEHDWLADRFEENRTHLRAVAYRMLGSLSEAEDAVQEAWLRLSRLDPSGIGNLRGWLTTVVARLCLDMLRSRKSRREEPMDEREPTPDRKREGLDPETEVLLADSVGLALLVVLQTLSPAERIAFVLHDLFDMSFDEIAPIVERSPGAARQLASRARRRVHGTAAVPDADLTGQRQVINAFLAASREGNFEALLAVLDPEVVARVDRAAVPPGAPTEIRGASAVANRAVEAGARAGRLAMVNGAAGVVVAPRGHLMMVLVFTIRNGKITEIEGVAGPERLAAMDLAVFPD